MRIPMTWGISKGLEQLDRDAMMRNDPWSPDAPDFTEAPPPSPQEEKGMDWGTDATKRKRDDLVSESSGAAANAPLYRPATSSPSRRRPRVARGAAIAPSLPPEL